MNQLKNIMMALTAVLLLTGGLTACKKEKKNEEVIIAKYVPETLQDPIALPASTRDTQVNWLEKDYVVTLSREPATAKAHLVDERGQEYVDNRITLSVTRSDGSVFLKKEFSKESFASYLNDDFRKNGSLETIAFHEIDNDQLKFGVVVSRPDNDDLFIPLDMWIDRHGGIAIKQGKLFDEITHEDEGV